MEGFERLGNVLKDPEKCNPRNVHERSSRQVMNDHNFKSIG
jgi:hypothetical protein